MSQSFYARWVPQLPIAVAILLTLPSVWVGLQLDDYFHWALVTHNELVSAGKDLGGLFGLFTFLDGDIKRTQFLMDQGMVPWWTLPDIKYAFWRPVSELTHAIDYSLWPKQPVLMHLHSLFYFGLVLFMAHRLFKLLLTDATTVVLATWLFAMSYSHGLPAGWLANRNALLATLFVILTLYCHHRWRDQVESKWLVGGLIAFAMGLLSGELAVSAGLILFSYALFMENKPGILRLFTIVPYAVLGLIWIILRALMGYGAKGSGHYIDPTDFGSAMSTVLGRAVELLFGQFFSAPPEIMTLFPGRLPVELVLLVLLVVALVPFIWQRKTARFWAFATLICVLPVCATIPHSRLLFCVSLVAAPFVALFVTQRKSLEIYQSGFRFFATPVSVVLLLAGFVLSPLLLPFETVSIRLAMDSSVNKGALNLPVEVAGVDRVFLINPPMSSIAGYMNGIRSYHGLPVAEAMVPLVSGLQTLQVMRVSETAIEISAPKGVYNEIQEGLLRAPSNRFAVNDQVSFSGIQATVKAVNELGVPSVVEFDFGNELESIKLLHWNKGTPATCKLRIAARVELSPKSESCH